ncbi:MAG: hypothetical protein E4H40_01360 [Candidatus Brocadiia bacterium]|nr:MAG: hypothetical protein E4H40_01360 [Candidatus Brocadiia bacterium]
MNAELTKKTEEIENARKAKTSEIPNTFKYAVMGKFETSSVYSTGADLKRYRIVDEFGKTVCFAVPTSPSMKLNDYVGKKVGLVGTIESFPQASSALVRFTAIDKLE